MTAILDRIRDIEATISRIEADATELPPSSYAYRVTMQSLEKRLAVLREEEAARANVGVEL